MNPELHARATELFLEICDLPPAEQDRALATTGARDPALRDEVLSLLRHDDSNLPGSQAIGVGAPIEPLPEQVGPYRILEFLGAGGMAEVYLAEGAHPERQRVAVKILRPGPSSGEILARFEAERQSLARLDHPGIATVMDAGTAKDGRRYFAMEYVPGIAITEYCHGHRLSLRERLRLFAQVCDAAHHAHERGIIHRDLKPSNILVFLDGDRPGIKIIDFGVARAVGALPAEGVMNTHHGSLLGTPAYMSPEQAEMSGLDIDGRTDVYSLGALLNELLTGKLPIDWQSLESASLDGIRHAIREAELKPPSVQLEERGEQAWDQARHCRTDLSSLVGELRGPLDEIVLTALDKDRTRRYATTADLGAEVERFLRDVAPGSQPARVGALASGKHRGRWIELGLALFLLATLSGAVGWFALRPQGRAESASERAFRTARARAARIQFDLERRDPEIRLSESAKLTSGDSPLPEAILVRAQAMIRTGRSVGSPDLERSAIGELLRYEGDSSYSPWPARAAVRALLAEVSPRVPSGPETGAIELPGTPASAEDWYLLSFATLDLEEALARATTAADLEPDDPLRLRRLANLHESTGRFEQALADAERLVAMGEAAGEWMAFAAAVWLESGKPRKALETLDLHSDRTPLNPVLSHPLRATAHLCLDELSSAVAAYSDLIATAPTIKSGYLFYQRATPLWILGRLEEADADYEAFRRLDGRVTYADARLFSLRHELARRLEARGERAAAGQVRERAAAELMTARRSVANGSWLQRVLDSFAGERTPSELVASANPSNPEQICEAYYYAGEVCLLRGHPDEASLWFEKCLETGLVFDPTSFPPMPMNEYHLARFRLAQLED